MSSKTSALELFAKSKTKAKAEARKLSMADLSKLVLSLTEALEAEKAKAKERAEKDRQDKIAKINALLAESGLSPADLKAAKTPVKRGRKPGAAKRVTRNPVPHKYRIVVEGKTYEWTGRGRTPKVFQEYFDAGNTRESCTI